MITRVTVGHSSATDSTSDPQPTRVLLIDDHAVVREGVRAVLEAYTDIEVIAEAGSADEALALPQTLMPDVILSDLKMPGSRISDCIPRFKVLWPGVRTVIFSSFADAANVQSVLNAGAIGYLTKDALAADLQQAIISAHLGLPCVHPSVREAVNAQLPQVQAVAKLAPRERDVLRKLAQAHSNKEIARMLGMTEGTVKSYVSGLLEKLGLKDRTEAALLAARVDLG
jgi:DNA-binding NarL/FixJ family response regulator